MLLQMNFSITQTLLKIQLLWVNLWKPFEADEADSIDATQMIGGANEIQTAEGPSVLDETRLFDASGN